MTTRPTQAIMRKSLITIGLAAAALAAIIGLTGCGSSAAKVGQAAPGPVGQAAPGQPAGGPVYAANVVAADGYGVDPVTVIDGSQIARNLGLANRASGTKGALAEQVLVMTGGHPSNPVCKTSAICTASGMAAEVQQEDPGVQAHADGLVLRIAGTKAVFEKDGLPV